MARQRTSKMTGETFVDTDVLIYAHDLDASTKHQIAKVILQELWSERSGVLSMQVLQELCVNVTRKIASPLPKDSARLVVNTYATWCTETTPAEISAAFRIEDESQIGFWDALIVSAAAKSGATRILSEDLSAGPRISGVLIENPFRARPRDSKSPAG
jgi:predicted nucleic acid-binding protein